MPLAVKLYRPDGVTAIDCTPIINTARWSTASPGGFAAASCAFDRLRPNDVPYLSKLEITYGDTVAWQGLVESRKMRKLKDGNWFVAVQAFGWQRELDRVALARWYSRRDIEWEFEWPFEVGSAAGDQTVILSIGGVTRTLTLADALKITAGQLDPSDTTKYGLRIEGTGKALADNEGETAWLHVGNTSTASVQYPDVRMENSMYRVMGDYNLEGALWGATGLRAELVLLGSPPSWVPVGNLNWFSAGVLDVAGTGSFDVVPSPGDANIDGEGEDIANVFHCIMWNHSGAAVTPTKADAVELYNVRTLHTALQEDSPAGLRQWQWSGFYGGKLIRDILRMVPDLREGQIAPGDDWVIDAFPNPAGPGPKYARAYLDEISQYYDKRWAVWEDGRFDWKDRQDGSPEWVIRLDECLDGSEINGSVDDLHATVWINGQYAGQTPDYFVYAYDTGEDDLYITTATDRSLNPFVRNHKIADMIVDLPFQTGESAADQIAWALANYANVSPRVSGTLVVPADKMLTTPEGRRPAALLRAGEDVIIPDLPMDDLFRSADRPKIANPSSDRNERKSALAGDPGQTTFPIVGTSVDLKTNRVTIEVDNTGRFADTLMARLAAATRTVTG